MTLEILSIGTELLTGKTINTNAALLGQSLLFEGFPIRRVTTLPDDPLPLRQGIEEALQRSSIVITTGGLGPTGDDVTRKVVAEIFGAPLVPNVEVAQDLAKRFGKNFPTIEDQSILPQGAIVLPNPVGTAPGFILQGKGTIIVLPGMPAEMRAIIPSLTTYLESHCKKERFIETLYLCLLSEQQVDPYLRSLEQKHPDVEIGICPSYKTLSIYLHGASVERLIFVRDLIAQKFATHVFSTENKEIEVALQQWMISRGLTLGAAESCTGGHLAARLTKHPAASRYFLGSIVAYSNELKIQGLGVAPTTLQKFGAVSQEVVVEMASGAQRLTEGDYILALSGIVGPGGGTKEKPVGTIWAALRTPTQVFSGLIPIRGSARSRSTMIEYATNYLLASLYRYLVYQVEPDL